MKVSAGIYSSLKNKVYGAAINLKNGKQLA